MYEDFDTFLGYLEQKVISDGSVGLADAIHEFWKIPAPVNQAIKEQVTGRLHATGKYLVERGAETGSFLIRLNPNHELNEIVKATNVSIKSLNDEVLPKNFRIQRNLTMAAVIVAGASTIISLIALLNTSSKKQEQIVPLLQKPLQSLDSMQKYQKGIDSSLRKAVKDSFYQK